MIAPSTGGMELWGLLLGDSGAPSANGAIAWGSPGVSTPGGAPSTGDDAFARLFALLREQLNERPAPASATPSAAQERPGGEPRTETARDEAAAAENGGWPLLAPTTSADAPLPWTGDSLASFATTPEADGDGESGTGAVPTPASPERIPGAGPSPSPTPWGPAAVESTSASPLGEGEGLLPPAARSMASARTDPAEPVSTATIEHQAQGRPSAMPTVPLPAAREGGPTSDAPTVRASTPSTPLAAFPGAPARSETPHAPPPSPSSAVEGASAPGRTAAALDAVVAAESLEGTAPGILRPSLLPRLDLLRGDAGAGADRPLSSPALELDPTPAPTVAVRAEATLPLPRGGTASGELTLVLERPEPPAPVLAAAEWGRIVHTRAEAGRATQPPVLGAAESEPPPGPIAGIQPPRGATETPERVAPMDGSVQRPLEPAASGRASSSPTPIPATESPASVGPREPRPATGNPATLGPHPGSAMPSDPVAPAAEAPSSFPAPTPPAAAATTAGAPGGAVEEGIRQQLAETVVRTAQDALLASAQPGSARGELRTAELGTVRVHVDLANDGQVNVVLAAAGEEARGRLEAELDDLADALRVQRLQPAQLEVQASSPSEGGGTLSDPGRWGPGHDSSRATGAEQPPARARDEQNPREQGRRRHRRATPPGRLDVQA